jgi:hypothetical protein
LCEARAFEPFFDFLHFPTSPPDLEKIRADPETTILSVRSLGPLYTEIFDDPRYRESPSNRFLGTNFYNQDLYSLSRSWSKKTLPEFGGSTRWTETEIRQCLFPQCLFLSVQPRTDSIISSHGSVLPLECVFLCIFFSFKTSDIDLTAPIDLMGAVWALVLPGEVLIAPSI